MRLAAYAIGRESINVVAVSAGGKILRNKRKTGEKVTDRLYSIYRDVGSGESFSKVFSDLTVRLSELIGELKIKFDLTDELKRIGDEALKSSSPDFLISRGEFLYAKIFAKLSGMPFVDSAEIIRFDSFGNLNLGFSEYLVKEKFKETGGFVTGGFYGGDDKGNVRLFPRGGGDITGAILARALGAEAYENFTDVDGIMPVPPKIATECGAADFAFKPLDKLSFRQVERLTDFSVEAIHAEALNVLKGTGIPITIKNTFNELSLGTVISEKFADEKKFFFAADRAENVLETLKRKSDTVKLYSGFLSSVSGKEPREKYIFYLSPCRESEIKTERLKNMFEGTFFSGDEGVIFAINTEDFVAASKYLST